MADNKKKPNPIDSYVGARIRLRRNMLSMSQEKLAEHLGITFQQVQKYEKGTNRVGASRLQAIASILNAPVSFFFEGGPGQDEIASSGFQESAEQSPIISLTNSIDGLQLARAFLKIENPKFRRLIISLAKAMAEDGEEPGQLD